MTIYEVSNIEHCKVEEIGNPVFVYRITTNEGYQIRRNDDDENSGWKTVTTLRAIEDASILQILPDSDVADYSEEISDTEALRIITEGVVE